MSKIMNIVSEKTRPFLEKDTNGGKKHLHVTVPTWQRELVEQLKEENPHLYGFSAVIAVIIEEWATMKIGALDEQFGGNLPTNGQAEKTAVI